jgi:hypothetical protein
VAGITARLIRRHLAPIWLARAVFTVLGGWSAETTRPGSTRIVFSSMVKYLSATVAERSLGSPGLRVAVAGWLKDAADPQDR